ncbi:MAG: transcription antitermination factor NusB [Patescibacteria group bacterium]
MKTAADPRHQKRIQRFKRLFAISFKKPGFKPEIDALIVKNAPEWPIPKLNKVDLAILRLAVKELIQTKTVPPKVIVDEAIELAKTFGTEATPKFINGVLGAIIKHD